MDFCKPHVLQIQPSIQTKTACTSSCKLGKCHSVEERGFSIVITTLCSINSLIMRIVLSTMELATVRTSHSIPGMPRGNCLLLETKLQCMLGVGFQGVERIVFKKGLNSWIRFSMAYFDLKPWLRSKFEISPELRIPRLGERVTWWSEVHIASSLINKLLRNTKCLSSKGKTTMSKLQVEVLAAKKKGILPLAN